MKKSFLLILTNFSNIEILSYLCTIYLPNHAVQGSTKLCLNERVCMQENVKNPYNMPISSNFTHVCKES